MLVIESVENAEQRGRLLNAEILGFGLNSDASHLMRPSADGPAAAMLAALTDAALTPSAIGYINAHGTATPIGDVVETSAIKKLVGGAAPNVAVSSTKALHGHLLGASGAIEFIVAVMALRTGWIPPTCHYTQRDPQWDLDYVPNVARKDTSILAVMSNSFAFWGN